MGWRQIDANRMLWEGTIEYYDEDIITSDSLSACLVTKKYVDGDGSGSGFLPLAGGTMLGPIGLNTNNGPGIAGSIKGETSINQSSQQVSAGNINVSGGSSSVTSGGFGGDILAMGGGAGTIAAGPASGTINVSGGNSGTTGAGGAGGNVNASGGAALGTRAGGAGGSINTSGAAAAALNAGGRGGNITTSGGNLAAVRGGDIDTSATSVLGGDIITSNGGGTINTTGTGSMQFGISSTRTTVRGTATAARAISWPDASGTVLLGTYGQYLPTLSNVNNLDASAAYSMQYLQVGNVVHVSGRVDINPTLPATSTQLGISLPVASGLNNNFELAGTAFAPGIAGQGAAVLGDSTNDRAQMQFVSGDTTSQQMFLTFTYSVL